MRRMAPALAALVLTAGLPLSAPAAVPSAGSSVSAAALSDVREGYEHLTNDYYKKLDAKDLLDGAYDGIVAVLRLGGVTKPQLTRITPGGNDAANERRLSDLYTAAVARYGKRVSPRRIGYGEVAGLANSAHDRYTVFLTPQARAMLNESLDGGNFSGVGLSIDVDVKSGYLRVDEVIPAGPAMKAGVQDGDLITAIDGISTRGLTTAADSKRLRGKVGTRVGLTILREAKTLPHPVVVTRAIIHDPSVVSKMLPGHIGYVRLSVFGSTTGSELRSVLDRLYREGAQALVLDLRDNGGGYLSAAVDVSSNFVASGGVVSVEDRGGSNTQYDVNGSARKLLPLAVLVNGYTASASEITSGAIQDHSAGTLIGTRTFGKGVVQTIFPLPDGAAIKVTTQHYYTPRGRDINKVGIRPDMLEALQGHPKYGDLPRDTQLKAALDFLRDRIAAQARDNE